MITQYGTANIISSVPATRTQDNEGVSAIQVTNFQLQSGVSKVRNPLQFIPGLQELRLLTLTEMTERIQFGISAIQNATTQTQSGLSNIVYQTLKTLMGTSDIYNTTAQSQVGGAAVQNTTLQLATGVSNLLMETDQTLDGVSRLQVTTQQNLSGIADIRNTTTKPEEGISSVWLGPNIVNMRFDQTEYGVSDYKFKLIVEFDSVLTMTGPPVLFMSVNGISIQFTPDLYPWVGKTVQFDGYFSYGLTFNAGDLVWGNPPQYATQAFYLNDVNNNFDGILFTAATPGVTGNDIQISMGVLTQEFGPTVVPNVPFSFTVSGNLITIITATDGSSNNLTTGNDILNAYNSSSDAQALVTIQIQGDPTQIIQFGNQYTFWNAPDGLPTSSNLSSGLDAVVWDSSTGGTFTSANSATFNYDSGAPSYPTAPTPPVMTFAIPSNINLADVSLSSTNIVTLQTLTGVSNISGGVTVPLPEDVPTPIAQYMFVDGSFGNDSIGSNDLTGGNQNNSQPPPSLTSQGMYFNSQGNTVLTLSPQTIYDPSTAFSSFTWEGWIKTYSTNYQIIIDIDDFTATWHIGNPDGNLTFSLESETGSFFDTSVDAVPLATWTHVAVTWDLSTDTVTQYVNGISTGGPVVYSSFGTPIASPFMDVFNLGNGTSSGGLYGYMGEFRIYNTALTSDQITELYNLRRGIYGV